MFDLLGETDLAAGLAAAAVFVVLVFLVGVVVWIGVPLAVLVYLGTRLALPRPDEATRAIRESAARVARIERLARQVDSTTHPAARRQVEEIARLTEAALTLIRSSPARRVYAVPFLTDYLTPIEAVLTPYVQLAGRGVTLADKDLAEVENESLPRIVTELTRLRDDLYRSDLTELRVGKELVDMMSLPIVTKNPGTRS